MSATEIVTLARGDGSRIVDARRTFVRSATDWRALWAAHAGPGTSPPDVDFESRMVAAVFAGERPTPGYEIAIVDSRRDGGRLVLAVEERRPAAGAVAAQILVAPFHIVAVPRFDGEVVFENTPPVARTASAAPAAPARASSSGLDPNIAAALAYVVGPLSGVLILLAERSNRYVRFHAWQSIVGLGALWAFGFGCYALAFLALLVSASAFKTFLWMAAVTWTVWVIVWIVCLVGAITGRTWKLPLAGAYAGRKADR